MGHLDSVGGGGGGRGFITTGINTQFDWLTQILNTAECLLNILNILNILFLP